MTDDYYLCFACFLQKKGDHDWYCFDCHQPGEVVTCSSCWRVYHTACTEEEWQGPSFVCAVCKVRILNSI